MARTPVIALLTDTHAKRENLALIDDIFNQVYAYCKKHGIRLLFHTGDWFTDRSGQTLAVSLLIKRIIKKFTRAGIQIFTIPGNHDKPDLDAKESYLHLYDDIAGFTLYEEAACVPVGDLNFYFVPYFKSSELYLQQLLACKQMMADYDHQDAAHFLLTHQSINGVRNNDGTVVDEDLDADLFAAYDRVFVGHYHDRQIIKPNIEYMGSAYQGNFGERANDKGFTVMYDDGSCFRMPLNFPTYEKFVVPANNPKKAVEILHNYEKLKATGEQVHVRLIFAGSQQEIDALDVGKFTAAGIDVKKENVENAVLFTSIDDAEFTVMDKAGVIRGWGDYAKHIEMDKKQMLKGLKLLHTVNF